ncbi:carbon monoxide dehydrogenase subunit G [Mucilaginibacter frigoritolerans]|jgi:carbon monoxide dehydrogenase subunit G|uniref:Carbon monoxide dehydrogenase subunit G n=1 Tax=Mucilaginibacter frigoritolerans TaxID=652788 RepID=A0A562TTB5_9SPHI|nr:SRPBCC family protein [Mucilaginibacter frigoritolerans]TWI96802.1 carbon monoxide dehydrogenase subunit G [Mucilaginibacter frigoritolerans]
MTTFESKATINLPANTIYNFLSDFNNHQQLMPENIQNWTSTFNTAAFAIQNMGSISLKINSRTENSQIVIIPDQKPPFDMELKWELATNGADTLVTFTISAELNMMLKMLASGPLQKLADHETTALVSVIK